MMRRRVFSQHRAAIRRKQRVDEWPRVRHCMLHHAGRRCITNENVDAI
jgi:hypothetical protein